MIRPIRVLGEMHTQILSAKIQNSAEFSRFFHFREINGCIFSNYRVQY